MEAIDYTKIIRRFSEAGIRLWAEGDKLRFSAPKDGGIDDEKLAFLKKNKNEILSELNKNQNKFLLTDIQSAYLLGRLDTFEYGGVSCQIYMELAYESLDKERCQLCWKRLVEKHEMLRAVICEDGYQLIQDKTDTFRVKDLGAISGDELDTLREEMSSRVFPIGGWPYFAVAVSKCGDENVMHISFDFLIADWNSIWILLKEFEDLYFERGSFVPEESLTFRKYLQMENELISGPDGLKDKEYWLGRVNDLPGRPMLPVKEMKDTDNGFDRLVFDLPRDKWDWFCENVKQTGCTATAAVMAAYAMCLGAWSETKHFCLNLTLLNRIPVSPDVYDVIGDFTSVSLLEVILHKSESFADLVKRIQAQMMEDLDHRLFSGVKTMREYAARHGKDAAFFPYVFTGSIGLIQTDRFTGRNSGYGKSSTPQVFIDCQAMDGPEGLRINWDVRRGVFEPEMLEDMFEMYTHILTSLADSQAIWKEKKPVIVPRKQLEVRKAINATEKDYQAETLFQMVQQAAESHPDATAIIDKNGEITYRELIKRAYAIAAGLVANGINSKDNVGILFDKKIDQVVAVLGVLAAGCTYVPMDPGQPAKRLRTIAEKSEMGICICENEDARNLGDTCRKCTFESLALAQTPENAEAFSEASVEDIAYIIFTSGSTGEPKGVQICNRAACNTIKDINSRFGVTENDKILSLSKLNFDLSVYDIFGILSAGGTIVFSDEDKYLDPSDWGHLLIKHGITIWNTVPSFMTMLMEYCESTEGNLPLRLVLLSGDWIPVTLPGQIRKYAPDTCVVSLGGATEASIWSNYYVCKENETFSKSIPYGYPLANQGFFIADEFGLPVPDYVPGELCIYGDGLANGYLKNEQQNAAHFVHNKYLNRRVYKTGDYGYYRRDGVIIFLGRRDSQVKIRGHRIELEEIEKTLLRCRHVDKACVVVSTRANDAKCILAAVVPESNKQERDIASSTDKLSALNCPGDVAAYSKWEECRDRAALISILYGLQKAGVMLPDKGYTEEQAASADKIDLKNRWLIGYCLRALEREGYVKKKDDQYVTKTHIDDELMRKTIEELHGFEEKNAFRRYVSSAFENIYGVLSGQVNPVHLLYPQGSDEVLESLYVENMSARSLNGCAAEIVAADTKNREHIYRILEIGGGSAATSRCVLKKLKDAGLKAEYYFTDLSESFMAKAKQHLAEYENVYFQVFDMNEDYRKQGFLPSFFDAVIATGVLENARDIRRTLTGIKEMLRAGGIMLATEPGREENWILASQAFMMTPPEDDFRKEHLYLSEDEWRKVLTDITPGRLDEFPTAGRQADHLKLWIKRMGVEYTDVDSDKLQDDIKEFLPEYMMPSQIQVVKELPLTANGKIDRTKIEHWYVEKSVAEADERKKGKAEEIADPMEREVISLIAGALGLDTIAPDRNLYDYGADSLVQAQIVGKLKTYADEHFARDAVPFDRILRVMLNGTTASELTEFICQTCSSAESLKEEADHQGTPESAENNIGEITWLREGTGNPIVLLPPALGTLSGISDLVHAVCDNTPKPVAAITIRDSSRYCEIDAGDVIEKVADDYAALLMKAGKDSYRLAGYCMGGFLALEIARRLTDAGIEVEKLIMIDSIPVMEEIRDDVSIEFIFMNDFYMSPGKIFGEADDKAITSAISYIFREEGNKVTDNGYELLCDNERYRAVYELLKKLKNMSRDQRFEIYAKALSGSENAETSTEMLKEQFEVYEHSFEASKLQTEAYFGDLLFLRAVEDKPYFFLDRNAAIRFWKDVCIGEVEVIDIDGNHDSCVEGENADTVATLLLE